MTQCFDIYSLLRAVNRTHVNYFSLDVEGAELPILKTIPFEMISVDIFSVEYASLNRGNQTESLARLQQVRDFFKDTGHYEEVGIIPPGERNGLDVIFKRRNAWIPFYMVLFDFNPTLSRPELGHHCISGKCLDIFFFSQLFDCNVYIPQLLFLLMEDAMQRACFSRWLFTG